MRFRFGQFGQSGFRQQQNTGDGDGVFESHADRFRRIDDTSLPQVQILTTCANSFRLTAAREITLTVATITCTGCDVVPPPKMA